MAKDYFDVERGFRIETSETFTRGTIDPALDEPIGSVYLKSDGSVWQKLTSGVGVDKWRIIATQEYVDNAIDGRSWRDPAQAHDDTLYASIAAAETNLNGANLFDGVTLIEGDRVLLSNLTAGNENVYIVVGTPGAGATLVEDTNLATDGDALWVEAGTLYADTIWAYNGTAWVQIGAGDQTELGFIRTFIGKGAAGAETPTYSSTNFIANADSLETAIGKLDTQLKLTQDQVDNAYTTSLADGVTAITTLDSVLVDVVAAAHWRIYVQGSGAPDAARKEAVDIYAVHDGHNVAGGADATITDETVSKKLKIGSTLGIAYTIDVSGSGAAQVMRLRVSAATSSNFRAVRTNVNF